MNNSYTIISDQDYLAKINPITALSNYWTQHFQDGQLIQDLVTAQLYNKYQEGQAYHEMRAMLSRHDFPLFRYYLYKQITITRSDVTVVNDAVLRYHVYQGVFGQVSPWLPIARIPQFGVPLTNTVWYKVQLPYRIVNAQMFVDSLVKPTILIGANDFITDRHANAIYFRKNPFAFLNDQLQQDLTIWAIGVLVDEQEFQSSYGRIVGRHAVSTVNYKKAINAVIDSYISGTTLDTIIRFISACYNIPICNEPEIIEDVTRSHIITNKNIYKYHKNATVIAGKGKEIQKLDILTDELTIIRPQEIVRSISMPTIEMKETTVPLPPSFNTPLEVTSLVREWDTRRDRWVAKFKQNDEITLTLSNLSPHIALRVEFDLYLLGYWKGVDGAEQFTVSIDDTPILTTKFSTVKTEGVVLGHNQWYPNNVNTIRNPAFSEATIVESDTTALTWFKFPAVGFQNPITSEGPVYPRACKYRICIAVPHTKSTCTIKIAVTGINTDLWCVTYYQPTQSPYVTSVYSTTAEVYNMFRAFPQDLFNALYTPEYSMNYYIYPAVFWTIGLPANNEFKVTTIMPTVKNYPPITAGVTSDVCDAIPSISLPVYDHTSKRILNIKCKNEDTPVIFAGYTAAGFPKYRFKLYGTKDDVERFWELLDAYADRYGIALANYLDTRPNPYNQPTEQFIPSTINPLKFFLKMVLGARYIFGIVTRDLMDPTTISGSFTSAITDNLFPTIQLLLTIINSITVPIQSIYCKTEVSVFKERSVNVDFTNCRAFVNINSAQY